MTVLMLSVLAGCSGGVLDPQGPVGAGNRQILLNSLAVMLVIVVPTIIGALWFAWWFRASNAKARYDPGFTYSGRIELDRLVDPDADHPVSGRAHLLRLPRARPAKAARPAGPYA